MLTSYCCALDRCDVGLMKAVYVYREAGLVDAGVPQHFLYGGRYIDRLEKRNGIWRIARRTVVMDWNLNQPTSDMRIRPILSASARAAPS